MYDPEGYSLRFCDYKCNDENTVSFVTLNKVSGFLQRMDLARNDGFRTPIEGEGTLAIPWARNSPICPNECYDMELYDWTKVDIFDDAQKKRVNQMIEDHEPFEGEVLLDAKCFK